MNASKRIFDESHNTIPSSAPSQISPQQEQEESTTRTCPCKKLPLCLSSFTAAEYGDLHSLAKKASSSSTRSRYNLVNQKDKVTGYTPLHLAAQHGHVAATSFLLQLGCSIDATMLHRTAFSGSVATLRILLEHTQLQTLQHQHLLLSKDKTFGDFRTPLHKAAAGGRYLVVHLLLDTLRESNLLNEALTIKDSNQQTPLDVARQLVERQDEERQSVARWDEVAGGTADWSKCVQLLSNAETEVGNSRFGDGEGDDRATVIRQRQQQTTQAQPAAMTIPAHLTRLNDLNGCIGCTDSSGNCLTASWQNAFHKALGNVVEQKLSNQDACVVCPVTPEGTNPTTTATTATATTQTSSPFAERQQISTNFLSISPEPTVNCSGTADVGTTNSTVVKRGISCSACGKPSIALYPSSSSKGQQRLVCKQCKRRKL